MARHATRAGLSPSCGVLLAWRAAPTCTTSSSPLPELDGLQVPQRIRLGEGGPSLLPTTCS